MGIKKVSCNAIAFVPIFFLMIAGIAIAGQNVAEKTTAEEVRQEVGEALEALKGYSVERRDEALEKGKLAIDALDARIEETEDRVRRKWNQMDQAAREKAQAGLKSLRTKRNELAEWYGGMKQSSADAWEHVKKGFLESYEVLSKAYDEAVRKF